MTLNTAGKPPLGHQTDILLLVLLCDQDVGSVWFEVVGRDFAQNLHVDGEVHLQPALLDVVVPDPDEGVVKFWVNGLQIFEDELLVEHSFVERQRETSVNKLPVKKCHSDEASYEAEVGQMVRVDGGRWVDLQTVVTLSRVFEQTVHGVQHLVGQKEEPLSSQASVVQPLLSPKYDIQPPP